MPRASVPLGRRTRATARLLWLARSELSLPFWPASRLRALQNRRARAIVAHAFAHVPFFRDLSRRRGLAAGDFRTLADLEQLPLISADQLAREPERFYSNAFPEGEYFPYQTSGTSGRVRTVRHDLHGLTAVRAAGRREQRTVAAILGRTPTGSFLALVPAHSPSGALREYLDRHSLVPRSLQPPPVTVPPTLPLEETVARINAVRPSLMFGYGRTIGALFRRAVASGLELWRPRLVRYGGEAMLAEERDLVERVLGIPVIGGYGAAEAMRLGWECERHRGYHVNADLAAVRVLDGRGRAVAPGGSGELVVTNLVNRATVLLNYRLGDIVTLAASPCPCGRTLPLLSSVDGRTCDSVLLPDGRELPGLTMIGPLRAVPAVVQVQLVQADALRFAVRAVLRADCDRSAAASALVAALRRSLAAPIEVSVEILDELPAEPSGKTPVVLRRWRPA